ncbi:exopolysaccharide/PEP-CTERM locus tyrosine autokinase [Sphingomonas gellani]|uniref:Exopolysaccharide/PEP-CTERM locus tyrosine autokinase n=1 Tax=Sphingomonas gellani TaxID=1166340 RepID=A0A1H7YBL5_9SPHN|nr:AAA family ATPase [Sphingomonas gellani]SEM43254.1 exopolysaccharide/PEP-CTERM locus tyrosine autokinase [Sphingomonas gellani]
MRNARSDHPVRAGTSLLERAADTYDFGRMFRPAMPKRSSSEVPTEGQGIADDLVEQAAMPVFDEMESDFAPHFGPADGFGHGSAPEQGVGDVAPIDRLMLAQSGMIVPGAPVGPLAEEFRLVKRQLLATRERVVEGGAVDKARSVLVCSARPADGKTFCAINLALSLAAERDLKVLLVDADFAKPDVMRQLGLTEGPGLLDALADGSLDPETLVVRTDVPHLSVLPAGARTAMDTELLASARTRGVIARLLEADPDRLLVFDSPPALAASPASVLAMLVGQVMLVVRADRTPESEVGQAVGLLDACEHISLVLNAVSFVSGNARFGSYYGQDDRR